MRKGWLVGCALGSLAALGAPRGASADTFYVATDGSDSTGDGSAAQPWATITHAINEAIPPSGGHEVVVRDGTYVGTAYLSRGFDAPVVVRAEHPYHAKLTNVTGDNEAIRVYVVGPARVAFEGFVVSNAHESYGCPNGRESYYLIHLQDASSVTLRDNIIFGNNAPGRCNELLKVNRGSDTAYPRDIRVEGNLFYDPANAAGSDMIDAVRPGELDIVDNIFMGSASHPESQSFITLKRQVQTPPPDARSPRFVIARNVFLEYHGHSDQAFVQLGEDGDAEYMITDALVENNLIIGCSSAPLAAPFQWKGSQQIVTRANTIVGDLPGGSYGFRIGTEQENPPVAGFAITGNIWSDPTGSMGTRLVNSYGDVDNGSIVLDRNLYWNGGAALPAEGDVLISADEHRLEADPGLPTDQSGVVMPRWDESSQAFPSGAATIREEFLRLVESYGAIAAGSPAADAADPSAMPDHDIRRLARDGAPDVGAYELGASAGAGGGGVGGGWGGSPSAGGAGTGATASGGAAAGASAPTNAAGDESGCGCRLAGARPSATPAALAVVALLSASAWRRRPGRRARAGSALLLAALAGGSAASHAAEPPAGPAPTAAATVPEPGAVDQPPAAASASAVAEPGTSAAPGPTAPSSLPADEAARALFVDGQQRLAANDLSGALAAFRRADEIMGIPPTGLELARTLARLGKLLEAEKQARRVALHQPAPGEPASFAPARAEAAALAKELVARIPTVRFEVLGPAGAMTADERVRLLFDGHSIGARHRSRPLRVDPGRHELEVTAPGLSAERGSITLAEREQRIAQVTLEAPEVVLAPEQEGISPAVYAGFGVGAASLVAGTVTGLLTLSAASDLEERCPTKQCPMSEQEALQDARTLGNVSTALFIIGGLGVGVGLSSLLMSLGGEPSEEASDWAGADARTARGRAAHAPRVDLRVGPGRLGLAGQF